MISMKENPFDLRSLAVLQMNVGLQSPKKSERLSTPSNSPRVPSRSGPAGSEPLAFLERAYGPDHPEVAKMLHKLAFLYHGQEKYAEAEPLYKRSLAIAEKAFGAQSRELASILNNLGRLYHDRQRYSEAEALYKRSLAILEKHFGPDHPKVLRRRGNLTDLYRAQGSDHEAGRRPLSGAMLGRC